MHVIDVAIDDVLNHFQTGIEAFLAVMLAEHVIRENVADRFSVKNLLLLFHFAEPSCTSQVEHCLYKQICVILAVSEIFVETQFKEELRKT
jgi:hypothetical protein